eukprot:m.896670 g.896670  ORF g.896670 m.896670 type:complete len:82 (+) comp23667_c0_seq6:4086-4331(+)
MRDSHGNNQTYRTSKSTETRRKLDKDTKNECFGCCPPALTHCERNTVRTKMCLWSMVHEYHAFLTGSLVCNCTFRTVDRHA